MELWRWIVMGMTALAVVGPVAVAVEPPCEARDAITAAVDGGALCANGALDAQAPASCVVGEDRRDDAVGGAGADLTRLRLGTTPSALIAELDVRTPGESPGPADITRGPGHASRPRSAEAERSAGRWEISWQLPDGTAGSAFAERAGERSTFGYRSERGAGIAAGRIDLNRGNVRIEVPRAPLGLSDGRHIASIVGRAGAGSTVEDQLPDRASEIGSDLHFVIGAGCAAPASDACPVVRDASGDGPGALDIVAVGAEHGPRTVRLSIRIADAPDDGPMGWTASWSSHGARWIAQAERRARGGDVFRFGRALGLERPAAPRFGGRAATGHIGESVVTIDVPVEAFETGWVPSVGAVSWVRAGDNSAAAYSVIDRTSARPYRFGTSCPA